jgi:hypothetical protein
MAVPCFAVTGSDNRYDGNDGIPLYGSACCGSVVA